MNCLPGAQRLIGKELSLSDSNVWWNTASVYCFMHELLPCQLSNRILQDEDNLIVSGIQLDITSSEERMYGQVTRKSKGRYEYGVEMGLRTLVISRHCPFYYGVCFKQILFIGTTQTSLAPNTSSPWYFSSQRKRSAYSFQHPGQCLSHWLAVLGVATHPWTNYCVQGPKALWLAHVLFSVAAQKVPLDCYPHRNTCCQRSIS